MINDFCTNPSGPHWIGQVKNADGKDARQGVLRLPRRSTATCPLAEISREQLENIDCLICHDSGLPPRLSMPNDDGSWEWRPILWNNREGMERISVKRLGSLPTRTNCLRCHSASGGGPNWTSAATSSTSSRNPPRTHDVHMATEGEDRTCMTCHAGDDHRVLGRGVDLAATDTPGPTPVLRGKLPRQRPAQDLCARRSHQPRLLHYLPHTEVCEKRTDRHVP